MHLYFVTLYRFRVLIARTCECTTAFPRFKISKIYPILQASSAGQSILQSLELIVWKTARVFHYSWLAGYSFLAIHSIRLSGRKVLCHFNPEVENVDGWQDRMQWPQCLLGRGVDDSNPVGTRITAERGASHWRGGGGGGGFSGVFGNSTLGATVRKGSSHQGPQDA